MFWKRHKAVENDVDKTPYFVTNRLYLANLSMADLDPIHTYRNDIRCNFYQVYMEIEYKQVKRMIAYMQTIASLLPTYGSHVFGIYLKTNHQLIGELFIGLSKEVEDQTYDLGFTIAYEFQRQGYGYEINTGLFDHCSNTNQNIIFLASVYEQNLASLKLISKLGFTYYGFAFDQFFQQKGRILLHQKAIGNPRVPDFLTNPPKNP